VVGQLIRHGRVIRPEIGIQQVYQTEKGLRVEVVTPGGPAESAGLKGPRVVRKQRGPFVISQVDRSSADLIVGVDAEKVTTADDFLSYIEEKKPGDSIVVKIIRDGKMVEVPVVLGGTDPDANSPRASKI
jgi:S1-C subfamily serine protease